MSELRWGIMGTGSIAAKFAKGLTAAPGADLVAVGSRATSTAEAFALEHGALRAYASYEALASDPDVDAIYIATPHILHRENTLTCIAGGKAVLCEKPFAMNRREAEEMVAAARSAGTFLCEAMWTRFLPGTRRVRELIASGSIGEPRQLECDFGFRTDFNPEGRLFNPALGGGALLDVGIYCVAYARMVFGCAPSEIQSAAHLGETGVDEQSAYLFHYDSGALARMSSATRTQTAQRATISGTEGSIEIPGFWHAQEVIVNSEKESHPHLGNGYSHEAVAVAEALAAGATECAEITLDETLELSGTLDEIRAQWGLTYPADEVGE
jgi:predicted dehydrogenase